MREFFPNSPTKAALEKQVISIFYTSSSPRQKACFGISMANQTNLHQGTFGCFTLCASQVSALLYTPSLLKGSKLNKHFIYGLGRAKRKAAHH
jgi:hypothetical protein